MDYIGKQYKTVLTALNVMLKDTKDGFFEGTWSKAYLEIRKMVPHDDVWCFPDTNKGLSYVLGIIDKQLIKLGICVMKRHSGNRTVAFKLAMFTENEDQTEVINKSKEFDMNEITRFFSMNSEHDYVVPAITLANINSRVTSNYSACIHVGIDKGNGEVACFCGQHHKQDKDVWKSPSVEEAANITCKMCNKTMERLIRTSSDPYKAIMEKLGQKISEIETHTPKKGVNSTSVCMPTELVTEPRVIGNPITHDTMTLLNALSSPLYEEQPRDLIVGESLKLVVTAIPDYIHTGKTSKCVRCCFNISTRPCPRNKFGGLICNYMSKSSQTIFVETLKPV